jgi:hypothetical protein
MVFDLITVGMLAVGSLSDSVSWLPESHSFSHVADVSSSSVWHLLVNYSVICLIQEADGTLTDKASHELLLLYSCADAALEVAFVEHAD